MDTLPKELTNIIFGLLTPRERLASEMVCSKWRGQMDYSDIHKFDLVKDMGQDSKPSHNGTLLVTTPMQALLDRVGAQVTTVSFGHANLLITPIAVSLIDRKCPRLMHLDLSYTRMTENIVLSLIAIAPRLMTFNLDSATFSVRKLGGHAENMCILFDSLVLLDSINLQKTTIHNFPAVPFLPDTLRAVNFNNCSPMRADILHQFLSRVICLEELRLSTYSNYTVALFDLICSIESLRVFEMSNMAFSDIISSHGAGWLDLSPLCQLEELEELYLQYNNALENYAFHYICGHCQNIRVLNVDHCRNLSDYIPLTWLSELESLTIGAADTFTNTDLSALAHINGEHFYEFKANNCRIGNQGIQSLATYCPNLRVIRVDHCDDIGDDVIIALFHGCPELVDVSMQGASLTSKCLLNIASNSILRLKTFDLSYCRKVDNTGIEAMYKKMTNLVETKLRRRHNKLKIYAHSTKVRKQICVDLADLLEVQI